MPPTLSKRKPRRTSSAPKPRLAGSHEDSVAKRPATLSSPADLAAAVDILRAQDPKTIAALLKVGGPPPLRARPANFEGLAWIIVSQQVSKASATAIFARLALQLPRLDATQFLLAEEAALRACGLSGPKLRSLGELARAVGEGRLDFGALSEMDREQAHKTLLSIKGIGPWTADVFLLFCLGHPDVWPAGDLALQEAARLVLRLNQRPDARQLEEIGERWRPWRAVAARLLWSYYGAAVGAGLDRSPAPSRDERPGSSETEIPPLQSRRKGR